MNCFILDVASDDADQTFDEYFDLMTDEEVAAAVEKKRGLGDVTYAVLKTEVGYWENICNDYNIELDEVTDRLSKYMDRPLDEYKDAVTAFISRKSAVWESLENAKRRLEEAEDARKTYIGFYRKHYNFFAK